MSRARLVSQLVGANTALGNTTITGTANVSGAITANTLNVSTNTATIGTALYTVTGGSVGIGTNNPNDTLEVAGNNAFIRVNRTNNEPGISFRYNNSTSNRGDIAVTSNGAMYFTAGGSSEYMRLTASGNLGIGNTNPTNKLSVAGNISSNGTIDGNWFISSSSGSGYSTTEYYTGTSGVGTYMMLWPKSQDGAYFYGYVVLSNYTGPTVHEVFIHNIWNNNGSVVAAGSTKMGSSSLSIKRVTYNGATWVALQHNGEVNRNWRLSGVMNGINLRLGIVGTDTISDQTTYITV